MFIVREIFEATKRTKNLSLLHTLPRHVLLFTAASFVHRFPAISAPLSPHPLLRRPMFPHRALPSPHAAPGGSRAAQCRRRSPGPAGSSLSQAATTTPSPPSAPGHPAPSAAGCAVVWGWERETALRPHEPQRSWSYERSNVTGTAALKKATKTTNKRCQGLGAGELRPGGEAGAGGWARPRRRGGPGRAGRTRAGVPGGARGRAGTAAQGSGRSPAGAAPAGEVAGLRACPWAASHLALWAYRERFRSGRQRGPVWSIALPGRRTLRRLAVLLQEPPYRRAGAALEGRETHLLCLCPFSPPSFLLFSPTSFFFPFPFPSLSLHPLLSLPTPPLPPPLPSPLSFWLHLCTLCPFSSFFPPFFSFRFSPSLAFSLSHILFS